MTPAPGPASPQASPGADIAPPHAAGNSGSATPGSDLPPSHAAGDSTTLGTDFAMPEAGHGAGRGAFVTPESGSATGDAGHGALTRSASGSARSDAGHGAFSTQASGFAMSEAAHGGPVAGGSDIPAGFAGAAHGQEGSVGPDGAVPPAFLPPSYAEPRRGRVGRAYLRMLERVPRWLAPLAVLGCIGGAVGYTLISNPTDSAPDAPPTCVLKLTTGLDCPGCGGTRAAWYLLHGDLPAAARHHLLFVFAVPFIVYLYIAWAAQRVFGRKLPQLSIPPMAIVVFMGAWLAFSIMRNLPWAPFNWFYV